MQVKEISNRAMKRESDAIVISYIELENLPEVMKREVIHLGFEYVAGSVKDIADVLTLGRADAALAASIFHFGEITVQELKQELKQMNIDVRL